MKKYKLAAILMLIHGGLMEIGGSLALVPTLIGYNKLDLDTYFSFIVPYFQENLIMMAIMGGLYGIVRVIGAIGLLKNKMWGFALSIINCVITMALMIFMLPAGIIDGILASTALILMLLQYFGNKKLL
ncbi:MAG: DUF2127 domain-containing protein [Filifactoraceae bacterium]